jgi:hypothetical protein
MLLDSWIFLRVQMDYDAIESDCEAQGLDGFCDPE